MRTEELKYHLPSELIAQQPTEVRSDSRLLVFNRSSGEIIDSYFRRVGEFLLCGDCLVLNDTQVLPARFFGRRSSGGRIEGLYLAESSGGIWEVMLKCAGKLKRGEIICLRDKEGGDFCGAEVVDKPGEGICLLRIDSKADTGMILEQIGFAPLPPYIKRGDDISQGVKDKLRYQTVYARNTGAVAAPTAGLHFTKTLIEELQEAGICFAYITLHVGAGTFKPITTEHLEAHHIHKERFSIDEENAQIVNTAKEKGHRVIAVGTTSVRVLETVAVGSEVQAFSGETDLFIKPGYEFKMIDAMITNFHLPRSTLLALVAAFSGLENILAAYQHAIEQRYRFYSYGDAMLLVGR